MATRYHKRTFKRHAVFSSRLVDIFKITHPLTNLNSAFGKDVSFAWS